MTDRRVVSLVSAAHAEGLRTLSREPDFAGAAGIGVDLTLEEALDVVATATKAREEGRSFIFVLTNDSEVLGVCRLIGVLGVPRVIVSIGGAYRGRGNGSFIVRHVLDYAFESLGLERVTASGPCLRLISHFGRVDGHELTREAWLAER